MALIRFRKNLKNTYFFFKSQSTFKGQFGYLDASIWQYHCRTWWIIKYTKFNLVFLISYHQTLFEKFRLFFIQLIFMYGVGKCPIHTLAAAQLQRSYGIVAVSQKYQNFKKPETATYVIASSSTCTCKIIKSQILTYLCVLTSLIKL